MIFQRWRSKVDLLNHYILDNIDAGFMSYAFEYEIRSRSADLQNEVDRMSIVKMTSARTNLLRAKTLATMGRYTQVYSDVSAALRGIGNGDLSAIGKANQSLAILRNLQNDIQDTLKDINDAKDALN